MNESERLLQQLDTMAGGCHEPEVELDTFGLLRRYATDVLALRYLIDRYGESENSNLTSRLAGLIHEKMWERSFGIGIDTVLALAKKVEGTDHPETLGTLLSALAILSWQGGVTMDYSEVARFLTSCLRRNEVFSLGMIDSIIEVVEALIERNLLSLSDTSSRWGLLVALENCAQRADRPLALEIARVTTFLRSCGFSATGETGLGGERY